MTSQDYQIIPGAFDKDTLDNITDEHHQETKVEQSPITAANLQLKYNNEGQNHRWLHGNTSQSIFWQEYLKTQPFGDSHVKLKPTWLNSSTLLFDLGKLQADRLTCRLQGKFPAIYHPKEIKRSLTSKILQEKGMPPYHVFWRKFYPLLAIQSITCYLRSKTFPDQKQFLGTRTPLMMLMDYENQDRTREDDEDIGLFDYNEELLLESRKCKTRTIPFGFSFLGEELNQTLPLFLLNEIADLVIEVKLNNEVQQMIASSDSAFPILFDGKKFSPSSIEWNLQCDLYIMSDQDKKDYDVIPSIEIPFVRHTLYQFELPKHVELEKQTNIDLSKIFANKCLLDFTFVVQPISKLQTSNYLDIPSIDDDGFIDLFDNANLLLNDASKTDLQDADWWRSRFARKHKSTRAIYGYTFAKDGSLQNTSKNTGCFDLTGTELPMIFLQINRTLQKDHSLVFVKVSELLVLSLVKEQENQVVVRRIGIS